MKSKLRLGAFFLFTAVVSGNSFALPGGPSNENALYRFTHQAGGRAVLEHLASLDDGVAEIESARLSALFAAGVSPQFYKKLTKGKADVSLSGVAKSLSRDQWSRVNQIEPVRRFSKLLGEIETGLGQSEESDWHFDRRKLTSFDKKIINQVLYRFVEEQPKLTGHEPLKVLSQWRGQKFFVTQSEAIELPLQDGSTDVVRVERVVFDVNSYVEYKAAVRSLLQEDIELRKKNPNYKNHYYIVDDPMVGTLSERQLKEPLTPYVVAATGSEMNYVAPSQAEVDRNFADLQQVIRDRNLRILGIEPNSDPNRTSVAKLVGETWQRTDSKDPVNDARIKKSFAQNVKINLTRLVINGSIAAAGTFFWDGGSVYQALAYGLAAGGFSAGLGLHANPYMHYVKYPRSVATKVLKKMGYSSEDLENYNRYLANERFLTEPGSPYHDALAKKKFGKWSKIGVVNGISSTVKWGVALQGAFVAVLVGVKAATGFSLDSLLLEAPYYIDGAKTLSNYLYTISYVAGMGLWAQYPWDEFIKKVWDKFLVEAKNKAEVAKLALRARVGYLIGALAPNTFTFLFVSPDPTLKTVGGVGLLGVGAAGFVALARPDLAVTALKKTKQAGSWAMEKSGLRKLISFLGRSIRRAKHVLGTRMIRGCEKYLLDSSMTERSAESQPKTGTDD